MKRSSNGPDRPCFCLTSDLDWASDYALQDFMSLVEAFKIRPTLFATHASPLLTDLIAREAIEIGLHPNYLPGSSHGESIASVTGHLCGLFPQAKAFRSHHFFHSSGVEQEMVKRQILLDSNLSLYFQPGIVPLRRGSGLTCLPVFWEDDTHWSNGGTWEADKYIRRFLTPGLKILNVHPFFIAANIPDQNYYEEIRAHIPTLSARSVKKIRYPGAGARTFFIALLAELSRRSQPFYSLAELSRLFARSELRGPVKSKRSAVVRPASKRLD